jgi:hypothetical protein
MDTTQKNNIVNMISSNGSVYSQTTVFNVIEHFSSTIKQLI